ncbi:MAG: CDP-alcohol phosphatidyltransferase family protein [Candidatus Altiarchaeota archaeon]
MVKLTRHIPNSMTLFNIAVGLASIMLTLSGEYEKAAGMIIVSVIVDTFDGYVARLFNSTSRFGVYMDTVSDFLSFGIAAPLLMVRTFDVSLLVACFFTLSSAFRLVYFVRTKNPKFFYGLPSTVAGGFLATLAILKPHLPLPVWVLMFLLSLMMLSRIKYYRLDLRSKRTLSMILAVFMYLFVLDLMLAVNAVMATFLGYILFGWLKIKEVK